MENTSSTPQWSDVEPKKTEEKLSSQEQVAIIATTAKKVAEPANVVTTPRPQGLRAVEETGIVSLSSIDDQLHYARRLLAEQMVSDTFKKPEQVVIGIQMCKELGIPVLLGLKMMYVIKGRPSLFGDGPLSLCYRAGEVAKIREFFVNEKGEEISFANKNLKDEAWGSVTQVWRKGDELMQEDFFTKLDLERAELDTSKFGKKEVWEKFERNMMRYKARAMALKTKFPHLLSGVNIAEYHDHVDPSNPEVNFNNPQTNLIAEIKKYGETQVEATAESGGAE